MGVGPPLIRGEDGGSRMMLLQWKRRRWMLTWPLCAVFVVFFLSRFLEEEWLRAPTQMDTLGCWVGVGF